MKKSSFLFLSFIFSLFLYSNIQDKAYSEERAEIFPQLGHSGGRLETVAFSPDGKHILSAGQDKSIKVWEVATGKEIRTIGGHHLSEFCSISVSRDGHYVLSGEGNGTVRLWQMGMGKEIRTLGKSGGLAYSVAISPDGKYALATFFKSGYCLKLWEMESGKEMRIFQGEEKEQFTAVAFSPDGKYLLSGSRDKKVSLWDTSSGARIKTFEGHSEVVNSVAFSPDGKLALSGSSDKTAKLWDIDSGKELRTFQSKRYIPAVAFSPDGRYAALSGEGLNLWEIETGKEMWTFGKLFSAVAFSPDGRYLAGANFKGQTEMWEMKTGEPVRTFKGYTKEPVRSVSFSPDGKNILTARHGAIHLWDLSTASVKKTLKEGGKYFLNANSVKYLKNGKLILSAGRGSSPLLLWDIESEKQIRTFETDPKNIICLALSPDERYVLTGGRGALNLWDMETGKKIRSFDVHPGEINSVGFSPDSRYAFSAGFSEGIKIWEIESGKEIRSFTSLLRTWSADFSPDWAYALSGHPFGSLKYWDMAMGKELWSLKGQAESKFDQWVTAVAFSPDGRLALSGCQDGTLKLWNLESRKEIKAFEGHSNGVSQNAVAFSPDGRYALSGSLDHTARLWDVSSGKEIARFISFADDEWIVITPEGYYNSSLRAHNYLNVRMSNEVYGIDQFYDVFYRPDIVMAKLRGEDISSLITLTIDDALKAPPPDVEFTAVPSNTDNPKEKVCYQIKNKGGGIGEVRLFHNGKLVQSDGFYRDLAKTAYGKRQLAALNGKAIREDLRSVAVKSKGDFSPISSKAKGDSYSDCTEIEAVPGENELSLTAFNRDNTIQSFMKTVSFKSTRRQEDPHLYLFIVGIDRYRDRSIDLKYATKDATDIKGELLRQSKTLYKPENIQVEMFADERSTRENILGKISELSKIIRPTDSFIFFVAGHGVLLQDQYYMLTHDYDGTISDKSMISSNEIVEASKKIKSLSQLFIFDTCHAGGVDYIVSGLYDARMSILAKKMGLHIYASASSKQAAMDGYKSNGLFTHTLLNGLRDNQDADKNNDGKVSLVELGEYSKRMTAEISKQIGHSQTPLIINFGKDNPVYQLPK